MAPENKKWAARLANHKVIVLLIAAVAALFIYRFIAGGGEAGGGRPPGGAVYVALGEARLGVMREVGRYYGSLTAASKFSVAPRVGGELKELLVDIGDKLESGRLVARIDDETFVLLRDQAAHAVTLSQAQLDEARANLGLARNDLARQTNLSRKSIVSQSDLEAVENRLRQAEARLAVAESQLRSAKSLLENAELRLSYTRVTAAWPEGGPRYVGERLADAGDLVNEGQALLTVLSLDPLLVVTEVIERDYPRIKVGQTASLRTEAWPGEIFTARVLRVAPMLSAETRQARVELEVHNPDLKLKPGMFAELEFVFEEHQNVWSAPADVPFRRAGGFVVYIADPKTKTVREQPVGLGLEDNGWVELRGVENIEGPLVFIGQHLLRDGAAYALPMGEEESPAEGEKDEIGLRPDHAPAKVGSARPGRRSEAADGGIAAGRGAEQKPRFLRSSSTRRQVSLRTSTAKP